MMYSNEDILAALQKGDLGIEPCSAKAVKAAGITLHLGAKLLKPQPGTVVDVRHGRTPDYEEIEISADSPYPLPPGGFLLGHTFEQVTVGAALGFFIEGRSTLARVGLTIVQTAMLVYPGHRSRCVTLELANHGVNTILLYPRMKIARAAIFALKTPATVAYDDSGKYRCQELVGPPLFTDEIWED